MTRSDGDVRPSVSKDLQTLLYTLPPLLITLAAILTADSLQYTTRSKHVVQSCASAVAGYIGSALVTVLASGARPAVAVVVPLGGGLFIGSTVANRLTGGLPVLGVTTLGGLAAIGLAVVLGGITVITALAQLLALSLLDVFAGTALLLVVRSF